ncbi:MAG TPA: 2-amino-4-hydroxy-6-hydroxymethyldihydropteridine diphosphokinase [Pseudonocardia sp.]|jgi:2-amino-4-hydroxy-6-hydroxymethyldihydropteridine diphosphokinase|nr:2-amino-4-hydroxy-6-hydroxymethyldihydropteridine diphosphokinase [Pseudonocardia sp.]
MSGTVSSSAVLSLGSNLGDRLGHLRAAVAGFADAHDTELVAASPVYETAPWGGVPQDDFLNAVIIVRSAELDAWGWLRRGQKLEAEAGRVREVHWGPRTLDVDIVVAYRGDLPAGGSTGADEPDAVVFSDDPELLLPHPGSAERNTVLRPWLDIQPHAVLPGRGPVATLLAALGEDGLRRRDDLTLLGPA